MAVRELTPFLLTTRTLLTIAAWIGLNMALTLYNKWLLNDGRFPYPILMTISHQLIGFVLGLASLGKPDTVYHLKRAWKQFCFLSIFICATVSFGNLSLSYLHVSTVQIIKSTVPVFQIFVSKIVEGRSYPTQTNLVIPVMSMGAIMAIWGDRPDYSPLGYTLAFGSAVTQALHVSFSAVLVTDMKVSTQVTWLYSCFVSFILLIIPFWCLESAKFAAHAGKEGWSWACPYLAVGMMLAFSYNIMCLEFIKLTSSVWSSSAGFLKTILLITVSMVISPIQLHPVHYLGMSVVFLAFVVFAKLTTKRKKELSQEEIDEKVPIMEKEIAPSVEIEPTSSQIQGRRGIQ